MRSVRGLVGSRLASSRLTARDGRGLTARGHMARDLTPSDGSWAHSSSICELTYHYMRELTNNDMARELTPSYVSWAHSSSICGALLSLRVPVRNEQERQ